MVTGDVLFRVRHMVTIRERNATARQEKEEQREEREEREQTEEGEKEEKKKKR